MIIGRDTPAIVSGGASGLGAATVRALTTCGVSVAILDKDVQAGSQLAGEVSGIFVPTDVTDRRAVDAALDAAERQHGPARIVINCAGIAPAARSVNREGAPHDPDLFDRVLAVNLFGTFLVATRAAARMATAPHLNADGERGAIVNAASIAAYEGQVGQIAYAASKAGIVGMTLPMARDLAALGIRVNSIAPGIFRTPMVDQLPDDIQDSLAAQVPFPARLGDPDEFASLALEIIRNPMLNGTVLRLDGAIRMGVR